MRDTLRCAGRIVAHHVAEPELALRLAPRPYLHPVSTLGGTVVTDALPEDHPWHLGVCVALQHVTHRDAHGTRTTNFWGGRTYVPGQGYVWLDDHGRIEHRRWLSGQDSETGQPGRDGGSDESGRDGRAEQDGGSEQDSGGEQEGEFGQELVWRVPDGPDLLRERRTVTATPLDAERAGSPGWALRLRFGLHNVTAHPIELGSPGTAGRAGAGYGGFFWRAAASASVRVATAHGEGEVQVHGRTADWVLMSAAPDDPSGDGAVPAHGGGWSVLLSGEDDATRADPWFVRVGDYPGVGSALAYERPVVLAPGAGLTRSVMMTVLDGVLEPSQAPRVLTAARAGRAR